MYICIAQKLFILYLQMVNFVDHIFPVLLKTLSDTSDEVLILNLQVLAEICCPTNDKEPSKANYEAKHETASQRTAVPKAQKHSKKKFQFNNKSNNCNTTDVDCLPPSKFGNNNPHFRLFMLSLLKLFRADRNLLDTKGSFIIR